MAASNSDLSPVAIGLSKLFDQRESFIVIGLTGRTGSGCTTTAKVLGKEFADLSLRSAKNPLFSNEDRKYSIIFDWAQHKWRPFTTIKVSSLIFHFLARLSLDEIKELLASCSINVATSEKLETILNAANQAAEHYQSLLESNLEDETLYTYFFQTLSELAEDFKAELVGVDVGSYTAVMQLAGDNVRSSGSANQSVPNPDKIFALPELTNKLIKIARAENKRKSRPDYFVIDAIRNPFEAVYLRERYAAFYLFGITTDETSRQSRLSKLDYTHSDIEKLSGKEYPKESNLKDYELLVSQHIGKCIEGADIIIENPEAALDQNYPELTEALVKYISLIQHPGLIPPDQIERCMQVAITAKLNSGCISRQVGAAITDKNYSVKAIGWNSVPDGQVPCILRNVKRIANSSDKEAFSTFELTDKAFKKQFEKLKHFKKSSTALEGRPFTYCFKSTYNAVKGDKNQVHTRALHAEENAFLQLTKYGGTGIEGGHLFTTSSSCELCSKKAYQLGVQIIYYIDPYPGIANTHILDCGTKKPKLQLFTGALGRAYVQLYQPLVSLKDELEVLMS